MANGVEERARTGKQPAGLRWASFLLGWLFFGIGLLGTVWGVMTSFVNIGAQGSATLVVVAPGIAEALIATIAGLAAAIPAVIAYNHCLGRLREAAQRAQQFAGEYLERRAGAPRA